MANLNKRFMISRVHHGHPEGPLSDVIAVTDYEDKAFEYVIKKALMLHYSKELKDISSKVHFDYYITDLNEGVIYKAPLKFIHREGNYKGNTRIIKKDNYLSSLESKYSHILKELVNVELLGYDHYLSISEIKPAFTLEKTEVSTGKEILTVTIDSLDAINLDVL